METWTRVSHLLYWHLRETSECKTGILQYLGLTSLKELFRNLLGEVPPRHRHRQGEHILHRERR